MNSFKFVIAILIILSIIAMIISTTIIFAGDYTCYDKEGNKIIGETCLVENNGQFVDTHTPIVQVFMISIMSCFGLIILHPFSDSYNEYTNFFGFEYKEDKY